MREQPLPASAARPVIRRVRPDDMVALVALCAEHARYEKATYAAANPADALAQALFVELPHLHAWVAELTGELVGYATAASVFSTWQAGTYLHMDCLFVGEGRRGMGIGAALLRTVAAFASISGYTQMQWQTPDWNVDAIGFYRRFGTVEQAKRRFFLAMA